MTMKELDARYTAYIQNNPPNKKVIAKIINLLSKKTVKIKDIVSVYIDDVKKDPFFEMLFINYTYFYISKDISYKSTDSIILLYYIAADLSLTVEELLEIKNAMEEEGFSFKLLLDILSINKKLPKETKL